MKATRIALYAVLLFLLQVGAGTALGILGTSFVLGYFYWDPISLMFDIPVLVIAVFAGVQLGLRGNQRAPTKG